MSSVDDEQDLHVLHMSDSFVYSKTPNHNGNAEEYPVKHDNIPVLASVLE